MRISDWSSDVCSSDLLGQLRLADAGGAKEEEAAERPVRVLQARAGTADGGGHGLHGIGLADHALADFLLHLEQLLALALQHLVDWNAGPARDDRGDVLGRDRKSTRLNSSH